MAPAASPLVADDLDVEPRLQVDLFDARMLARRNAASVAAQARLCGMDASMMWRLRAGTHSIDLRRALKMARAAGVTVEELFVPPQRRRKAVA